eukprot:TRINITY_DN174_c0_g1_i22.p2 TRINITY_DN174_c0_g1~~TRINITY_DN174_c0_g1_i22.p2  ORF type:complete len:293 (+),score=41.41 TRINITY_DN174_c0_g1_i22:29-907(+)
MKARLARYAEQSYNKVVGLANNYYDPAKPLSQQPRPSEPIVFVKPISQVRCKPTHLLFKAVAPVVHEIELGFIVKKRCHNINTSQAMDYVGGYFMLMDYTSSLVSEWRKQGKSFCLAKGGDAFLMIGDYIDPSVIDNPHNVDLELKINNEIRQKDNSKNMMYNIPEQLAYSSRFFTLEEGDLFLTGTPAGIGPIKDNDLLQGQLAYKGKVLDQFTTKVNYENLDLPEFVKKGKQLKEMKGNRIVSHYQLFTMSFILHSFESNNKQNLTYVTAYVLAYKHDHFERNRCTLKRQ